MHSDTVIVVCGPTAVGKTAFAIQLALALHTQIISADSRQCFTELNIGVAKPLVHELREVPHYFINSHSIYNIVNAGVFEQYALETVAEIFKQNAFVVMVGGTGLYIKAFCEGLSNMPDIDPEVRNQIEEQYRQKGLGYLQQQLMLNDPQFWSTCEQQNPHRLMRALEVLRSTGNSITNYRTGAIAKRPFTVVKVGLELPRPVLYERTNKRVDTMMDEGLLNEVEDLMPHRDQNALQTVGYKELFRYFDGEVSLQQAIEDIKTSTRKYAKRQLTWFKKDKAIHWFSANDPDLLQKVLNLPQLLPQTV